MPRSRTVLKRQRQTEVRRVRNKGVRSELKTAEKRVRQTAATDAAEAEFQTLQKRLDKAAGKGVIHPNKAARKKSRLAKALRKASAPAT
ncbi:MAG TPA: 30S ribosomal protein S20 [Actinomycetota bacterium]|nr:30S ribosomal protein S20 [Actinomycetota bacterium]